MNAVLEVLAVGGLATVQDLGRHGYAHLGVPPSGALDRPSLRLANRLVGNDEGAAAIEILLGGARLRAHTSMWVAVTGAPCGAAMGTPVQLRDGKTLNIGPATEGVATYLAVRGGVDIAPVLGSRSTDLLSGIGALLAAGDHLPIGPQTSYRAMPVDVAPLEPIDSEPILAMRLGPRDDRFTAKALATLTSSTYSVTPVSNRVGLRLEGSPLERRDDTELAPEAMVTGSIQVPPDGQPILFLPDHPTTGGYPVIAVVVDADLRKAGQARPGSTIRFRLAARATATHQ
ncbi:MAG: biotin-dependent carboxyltransferase family protein [Acidimicrobiales bacterium]